MTPEISLAAAAGPDAFRVTSELYQTRATIDVDSLFARLEGEIVAFLERAYGRGLTDDQVAAELDAFLGQLSDKPINELARQSTGKAFNLGRNVELQRQEERVAFVIRTEILDGNTCDPCAALDGTRYDVGSAEYFDNMPPAKCAGADRCRGFYVPVSEAA